MPETAALDPAVKAVLKRPFAEQVAFFQAKLGRLLPTERWTDVWKEQHDRAFMVAGAQKADLLADLASAVDKAIAGGESIDAFRKRFSGIVQRHGWTGYRGAFDWRTRVIYATNLSTSYAAGRLAQLRQGGFPLWVYRHSDSVAHPRPQHVAWDGLTLPAGHPFWKTHYPPSGWGCRCYVLGARDAKGARRLGGDPGKALPGGWDAIDPKTGEPPGIDRGWGYMPGGTSELARTIRDKADGLPEPLGKALADDPKGTKAGATDAAGRRVLGLGRGDGVEHLALVDVSTGEVVGPVGGSEDRVYFTGEMLARLQGPSRPGTLDIVHNHPGSTSLSFEDLNCTAFYPAVRHCLAYGHDGSVYKGRVLVASDDFAEGYRKQDSRLHGFIQGRIDAGKLTIEQANHLHHHILNLYLKEEGLIEYEGRGFRLPSLSRELLDEFRSWKWVM